MQTKEARVNEIIDSLSIEEQVGQTLILNFTGSFHHPLVYRMINDFHCAGFRLSQTAINPPRDGYWRMAPYVTPEQYAQSLNHLQSIALQRAHHIPLHFAIDQEGDKSSNYCMGGVHYLPSSAGLVACGDASYARKAALALAQQLRAIGVHWIHSPCLDVNVDYMNPEIGARSFSDDAHICSQYGRAFMEGLRDGRLIATGKHFPGRGDSSVDAHNDVASVNVSRATLLDRDIKPYSDNLDLLPSIMLAHTAFPSLDPSGKPATISKPIVTDFLRNELGFNGVITTDNMEMKGITKLMSIPEACKQAVAAGSDLVLMKAENEELVEGCFNAILDAVRSGEISEEQLTASNRRVLALKMEYGIFDSPMTDASKAAEPLHDPEVIRIAAETTEKGIRIVKDESHLLPLDASKRVLLVEQGHDPLTVVHVEDFWNHSGQLGEDLLGRVAMLEHDLVKWEPDEDDMERIESSLKKDYDVAIVTAWLLRSTRSFNDIIDRIKAKGIPVICLVNTPYPYSINNNADATVVSYQVRGNGCHLLADVLFGERKAVGEWPLIGGMQ
jgi:beta-N-acetylhexosaminidase